MSLLHHREHTVPFDQPHTDLEADLRAQIGRLHAERQDLCSLIEEQRVELARAERENHELRRRLAAIEKQERRSPWPRRKGRL